MHGAIAYWLAWGELLWSIGWIVVMILGHTMGNEGYNNVIAAMFFHFIHTTVAVAGAFYLYRNNEMQGNVLRRIHWSILWVFIPFIAMDASNIVRANYLPTASMLWPGTITLASVALFLSVSTFLWYFTVLLKHMPTQNSVTIASTKSRLRP